MTLEHQPPFPIEATKLFNEQELNESFDRLARRIQSEIGDATPIFVSVLNGGLMFSAEILKRCRFALEQDYVHATRYDKNLSGGELKWIAEPCVNPHDRVIVLLDDIFDEGITLDCLHAYYLKRGAKQVYSAVMVHKSKSRETSYKPDWHAVTADDSYLFGMGLDYKGFWRNMPAIYALHL